MIILCLTAELPPFLIHWEEDFVLWITSLEISFHSGPHSLASPGRDFKCHEKIESQSFPTCPTPAQVTKRPEFHLSSPSSSFPPVGAGELEGLCAPQGEAVSALLPCPQLSGIGLSSTRWRFFGKYLVVVANFLCGLGSLEIWPHTLAYAEPLKVY